MQHQCCVRSGEAVALSHLRIDQATALRNHRGRLGAIALHPQKTGEQPAEAHIAAGGAANSRVWVSTGSPPKRGAFDFVYYTGYESLMALGRHKLTDYALQRASGLIVVR